MDRIHGGEARYPAVQLVSPASVGASCSSWSTTLAKSVLAGMTSTWSHSPADRPSRRERAWPGLASSRRRCGAAGRLLRPSRGRMVAVAAGEGAQVLAIPACRGLQRRRRGRKRRRPTRDPGRTGRKATTSDQVGPRCRRRALPAGQAIGRARRVGCRSGRGRGQERGGEPGEWRPRREMPRQQWPNMAGVRPRVTRGRTATRVRAVRAWYCGPVRGGSG